MLDTYITRYGDKKNHQQVCEEIRNRLSEKYWWMDAVVSVYDPVSGDHKHQVRGGIFLKRKNGHNVVVLMSHKLEQWDNSQDKFIIKSRFNEDVIEYGIKPSLHKNSAAREVLERIYRTTKCNRFASCRATVLADVGSGTTLATPNNQQYTFITKKYHYHYSRPSLYVVIISISNKRFLGKSIKKSF